MAGNDAFSPLENVEAATHARKSGWNKGGTQKDKSVFQEKYDGRFRRRPQHLEGKIPSLNIERAKIGFVE